MRVVIFLILLMALAAPAFASEPGYFKVSGVAAGDVLNIRAAPDPKAETIGEFQPETVAIEVLEVVSTGVGEWGRVLAADTDGWVSMKFLETFTVTYIPGTELPSGLQCSGTEPFWDSVLSDGNLSFSAIDQSEESQPLVSAVTTLGRQYRYALVSESGSKRMTAIIAQDHECSDGMSDRHYRWRIDLLREDSASTDMPVAYEGCCRLPVR